MSPRESVEQLLRELVSALEVEELSAQLTVDQARADDIVRTLAEVAMAPARHLDWVVINDRRVDAAISTSDREWRIACSIDRDGVHSASCFERPAPFAGVRGGRAVIVTGPSSVGKSTVMRAVIDAADSPWVMFDELFFGTVSWPFLIWPDRSPTLRHGFITGITALAAAGNQVILSGAGANGPSEGLDVLVKSVPTVVVGLDCPLKVRVARQAARDDRWGGLTEEADASHSGWVLNARFDTSKLSPAEIARSILTLVEDALRQ